jgi:hypothetical protein
MALRPESIQGSLKFNSTAMISTVNTVEAAARASLRSLGGRVDFDDSSHWKQVKTPTK